MNQFNRYFLKVLIVGSTGFLLGSLFIGQFFPIPEFAVLVERSFCSSEQWLGVSQTYAELYHQNQFKQVNLTPVILFSDLGEEVLESPLTPEEFNSLTTFGRSNSKRLSLLKKNYPNAQILRCLPLGTQ
ncbi:MAG: hypothetical protein WBA93_28575 [Microcoleaceae cyanobacterium]